MTAIVPFPFTLVPTHKPEDLLANMRSAVARKLPVVSRCAAHEEVLSIVGGGPSLADTWRELTGYVAAINGSLGWLLDKGIVPHVCGVCDPSPHMVDIVVADPRVTYFIASCVHPSVFDKLLKAGCKVFLWHCSSIPGGVELLAEIEPDYLLIGGGSTMGLRWLTLGYTLGFRRFDLHGMDSSFRDKASHAYPDHQDTKDWVGFENYKTRINFIGQVADFVGWLDRLKEDDVDVIDLRVFGGGLLQTKFKEWKGSNPGWHEGTPKPKARTRLTIATVNVGNYLGRGAEYVAKLFDGVRRHMPAGVEYRLVCFTDDLASLPADVEAIPVPIGLSGWWAKLAMFQPGVFGTGERILYFDLDTIIAGNLSAFATYRGPFAIMRDVYRPDHMQSSVMAWRAGSLDHIWTAFEASGWPMFHPGGDQGFIEAMQPVVDYWQDLYPGQVVSYKADCRPLGRLPTNARIVVFHGAPRPHEVRVAWVKALWSGSVADVSETEKENASENIQIQW